MNGRFSQVVIAIVDRDLLPFFRRAGVIHILQFATIERITANAGDAITESDRSQLGAPSERIIANGDDAITESDGGQLGAISERRIANGGNAVGDDDRGQIGAIIECRIANGGDAVAERDRGQVGAMIERILANSGDTIGDSKACIGFANGVLHQSFTVFRVEIAVNRAIVLVAFCYSNIGQVTAITERRTTYGGDAIGDSDGGDSIAIKCSVANGTNGQAIIGCGNFDSGSGAAITNDDRIGAVIRNLVDYALGGPAESAFAIFAIGMPHFFHRKPLLPLAKRTNTHLLSLCDA